MKIYIQAISLALSVSAIQSMYPMVGVTSTDQALFDAVQAGDKERVSNQ